MTREEAIAYFKDMNDCTYGDVEPIQMEISDMEKQIPKKPIPINYEQYVGVVRNAHYLRNRSWCPNCHTDINSGRYCVNCGQLLDWSDK